MDVTLPDGTVIKDVPDGMSKADLTAKLASNGYDVSKLAAPAAPAPEAPSRVFGQADPAAIEAFRANKDASVTGAVRGLSDVGGALINGGLGAAHWLQQKFGGPTNQPGAADKWNAERNASLADLDQANADKPAYAQSRLVSNVAATYPVGGALAAPVKAAARVIPALAPLAEAIASGGFTTGRKVAPGLIPAAADLATRTAGGAATGAATGALSGQDNGAETGAIIGGLAPGGTKVAGALARGAGTVANVVQGAVEPLTDAGRKLIAGRTMNTVAGREAPEVADRLAAASPVVPGSMPTAGQVADNGGIAALERTASAANPGDFTYRSMAQASARMQALRGIAGDDASLAAAKAARGDVAKQLYGEAFANKGAVTPSQLKAQADLFGSGKIDRLLQAPAIQDAQNLARTNALNRGEPVDLDPGSIRGLHSMKLALDDMIKDPKTAGQADTVGGLRAAQARLLDVIETLAPKYKDARTTYEAMSAPVNKMEVGQALYNKMKPELTNHGALASETAATYGTALRNADQTAKTATGFKGASLETVLGPQGMDTINGVAQDLARKSNAERLGRGSGSDSFQKFSMGNVVGQSGSPRLTEALLKIPGVSKLTNWAYKGSDSKIGEIIQQALLDPQTGALLMRNAATPQDRALAELFTNPNLQAVAHRGASGAARLGAGQQAP